MNISTRQKAVRSIIASLLSGAFSDREIEEIAASLERDDDFASQLGSALRDVAERLSTSTRLAQPTTDLPTSSPATTEARFLIKKLGITQRQLIEIVGKIAPNHFESLERKRWPTSKLVDRLFQSSGETGELLLKDLRARAGERGGGNDPYLDLIDKR